MSFFASHRLRSLVPFKRALFCSGAGGWCSIIVDGPRHRLLRVVLRIFTVVQRTCAVRCSVVDLGLGTTVQIASSPLSGSTSWKFTLLTLTRCSLSKLLSPCVCPVPHNQCTTCGMAMEHLSSFPPIACTSYQ